MSGTSRSAGGAVATAGYMAVLTNTVCGWTAELILAAAIAAGLAPGEVTSLIGVLERQI